MSTGRAALTGGVYQGETLRIAYLSCVGEPQDSHSQKYFSALIAAGHEIIAIMPGGKELPERPGFRHVRLPRPTHHFWSNQKFRRSLAALWQRGANAARLARHLRVARPEVCVAMELDSWVVAVALRRSLGYRLVADLREVFVDRASAFPRLVRAPVARAIDFGMQRLTRRTDTVLHVSEARLRLHDHLGGNTAVVGGCYPRLADFPAPGKGTIGERVAAGGPVVLMHAGALRPSYGSDRLLIALDIARESIPDVQLQVFGGIAGELPGMDGLIRDLERSGNLVLNEPMPYQDVIAAMEHVDIGVNIVSSIDLTTRYAQPRKLYEYLAAGLPVIASDVPTISEVVAEWHCGLTVDCSDPANVARSIVELARDPETRITMGYNARRAAEARYNWEAEEKKLQAVVADLATARGP